MAFSLPPDSIPPAENTLRDTVTTLAAMWEMIARCRDEGRPFSIRPDTRPAA